MITLRRHTERHHDQGRKRDVWQTFDARDRADPLADGFGSLAGLDEIRISPRGGAAWRPRDEAETVTYVLLGTLAHEDSGGTSGMIRAGEFQRMTAGRGVRYKEVNLSRSDWAHVFRISLKTPERGLAPAHEQRRFTAAERRNVLCVVASPDGRDGSLCVHQDTFVYSSMVDPGHHLVHELLQARSAWLHIMHGEATLNDVVLTEGDGAGVTTEASLSLTAHESAEILLIDSASTPGSIGSGATA